MICVLIQLNSHWLCRLIGGVTKKTSISLKFDYDGVIYVNDLDRPSAELIDEWNNILPLNLRTPLPAP